VIAALGAGCLSKPEAPPVACSATTPFVSIEVPGIADPGEPHTSPWLSEDRRELWFAHDPGAGFQLLHAHRDDPTAAFGLLSVPAVDAFGATNDNPFVSDDGTTLWWDSNRSGADQIYEASGSLAGDFAGLPIVHDELGPLREPALSADGTTLYFAIPSSPPALGYASRKVGGDKFDAVHQLSPLAAESPTVSADGGTLIFTNQAVGTHLYQATLVRGTLGAEAPIELGLGAAQTYDGNLSRDGLTLVFAAKVGAQPSIYIATRSCL